MTADRRDAISACEGCGHGRSSAALESKVRSVAGVCSRLLRPGTSHERCVRSDRRRGVRWDGRFIVRQHHERHGWKFRNVELCSRSLPGAIVADARGRLRHGERADQLSNWQLTASYNRLLWLPPVYSRDSSLVVATDSTLRGPRRVALIRAPGPPNVRRHAPSKLKRFMSTYVRC